MSTKFIPDRKCYQKFAVGHKNKVLPPYKYMWHKAFLEIAFFLSLIKKQRQKDLPHSLIIRRRCYRLQGCDQNPSRRPIYSTSPIARACRRAKPARRRRRRGPNRGRLSVEELEGCCAMAKKMCARVMVFVGLCSTAVLVM